MVTDTNTDLSQEPSQAIAHSLIRLMREHRVLKFGEFTLKSGRISPYFANFGGFHTGAASEKLGKLYAERIVALAASSWNQYFPILAKGGVLSENPEFVPASYFEKSDAKSLRFDVIFGPAYKGIPLATHASAALSVLGYDVPWAFNRKEAKDHGEGGLIVGASLEGRRVLIVDDVITAGTALGEAIEIIEKAGGIPFGAVVAFDRMEKGKEGDLSAVQESRRKYGIPVVAIATLQDLLGYLEKFPEEIGENADWLAGRIEEYRAQYGADYSVSPS